MNASEIGFRFVDDLPPNGETDDGDTSDLHNAELRDLENQQRQEQIKDLRQDREQRKTYSDALFRLMLGWSIALAVIVFMDGACCVRFQLSERVLLALIGSTTASVFGLFFVVAKYLFPTR